MLKSPQTSARNPKGILWRTISICGRKAQWSERGFRYTEIIQILTVGYSLGESIAIWCSNVAVLAQYDCRTLKSWWTYISVAGSLYIGCGGH